MADVFISYAREDHIQAESISAELQRLGFEVFWDKEIPPGQTWADYIETKLRACTVMLVLWSATSTASQWVREEARIARDAKKLIPVMLDGSTPPFGFGEVQGANLSTWTGQSDHPDWQRLVRAVKDATGKAPDMSGRSSTMASATGQSPPLRVDAASFSGAAAATRTATASAKPGERLSPPGYVAKCLRLCADGKGRAGQAEYWWFYLFGIVLYVIGYVVDAVLFGTNYDGTPLLPALSAVAGLGLLAPAFAVTARRLHDFGMNGWIAIAALIPLVGIIIGLVPGHRDTNDYGPPP
jgi:uncharacterized membrane protein YhaH (DUF805 family)